MGVYRGACYDNQDPEGNSRIVLTCPQVLSTNTSNWAPPMLPVTSLSTHLNHTDTVTSSGPSSGTSHTHTVTLNSSHSPHITVPTVGQAVWVMFEGGDPNFPIWVGVF